MENIITKIRINKTDQPKYMNEYMKTYCKDQVKTKCHLEGCNSHYKQYTKYKHVASARHKKAMENLMNTNLILN